MTGHVEALNKTKRSDKLAEDIKAAVEKALEELNGSKYHPMESKGTINRALNQLYKDLDNFSQHKAIKYLQNVGQALSEQKGNDKDVEGTAFNKLQSALLDQLDNKNFEGMLRKGFAELRDIKAEIDASRNNTSKFDSDHLSKITSKISKYSAAKEEEVARDSFTR